MHINDFSANKPVWNLSSDSSPGLDSKPSKINPNSDLEIKGFELSAQERQSLTDSQIMKRAEGFLAKKYPDFFTKSLSHPSSVPEFTKEFPRNFKFLVNDLKSIYKLVQNKGIFVEYLNSLTKMTKSYSQNDAANQGSPKFSNLNSPEYASFLLDIYADLKGNKQQQLITESILITNLDHILHDASMNKKLEALLGDNHRKASDLGLLFHFRKGYGDLADELNPAAKASSAHDLLFKPEFILERSVSDADVIERQSINKFKQNNPLSPIVFSEDKHLGFTSLEFQGPAMHLNKELMIDLIHLVNGLNFSPNIKANLGLSFKMPFDDNVLLTSDLSEDTQIKLKENSLKSFDQVKFRNPTIFENLKGTLDKDKMLAFENLPLVNAQHSKKIKDRTAPLQIGNFINQALLLKAMAQIRFDNKGKLANHLSLNELQGNLSSKSSYVDDFAALILDPNSKESQTFLEEIYTSISQIKDLGNLKIAIKQLANEQCLPPLNPKFINKMVKSFIGDRGEQSLLIKLNQRLQGKAFKKEIFEMNDEKLLGLLQFALKPDSPQTKSLIKTRLDLSEPIELKSLFNFSSLLKPEILTDRGIVDLFIDKLDKKISFEDFAEKVLLAKDDIPKDIFEKIFTKKVEAAPDVGQKLLKILNQHSLINQNNLDLFHKIVWGSRPKFSYVDDELFSSESPSKREFRSELGALKFHYIQPFIPSINIVNFLDIVEQVKLRGESILKEPFRIKFDLKKVEYPDLENSDYIFQSKAENKQPIPEQPLIENQSSLMQEMFLEDLAKIRIKSFSLPREEQPRASLLNRISALDEGAKEKIFLAMKIPDGAILNELLKAGIFPAKLHDRLIERSTGSPRNIASIFNSAFSFQARENLLLKIINENRNNINPVIKELNKHLSKNTNSRNNAFLETTMSKIGSQADYVRGLGRLLEHLPELTMQDSQVQTILKSIKYIEAKSLNAILAKPSFAISNKLNLLERVFRSELGIHDALKRLLVEQKDRRDKEYTVPINKILIPEGSKMSSVIDTVKTMPSEIQNMMMNHLEIKSGKQLGEVYSNAKLSDLDREKLGKTIKAFDEELLPYLSKNGLSSDVKRHIINLAQQQKQHKVLFNFIENNKDNTLVREAVLDFVKQKANYLEYLPRWGFSAAEIKQLTQNLKKIDPNNYPKLFLTNTSNNLANKIPDESLALMTKFALAEKENVEAFLKFVIDNEAKLNPVVKRLI